MIKSVMSLRVVVVVVERKRKKGLLIATLGHCKQQHPPLSAAFNSSVGKGVMCILQMKKLSLREELQNSKARIGRNRFV